MYTKKKLFKILSFAIIYLSTSIFSLSVTSDALSKIFKIQDIEISVPFDTKFDKEKVINKAFSAAFNELVSSVIITSDKPKVQYAKLDEIK